MQSIVCLDREYARYSNGLPAGLIVEELSEMEEGWTTETLASLKASEPYYYYYNTAPLPLKIYVYGVRKVFSMRFMKTIEQVLVVAFEELVWINLELNARLIRV